jgi:nitric-oxide synthase, brain
MKSEKTTDSPSLYKNNLKFAVFGLGNSSYPKYCAYAKFLDCCLAESGAERIHCIGLGDELCGQEESFRKWSISVFKVKYIYINYS